MAESLDIIRHTRCSQPIVVMCVASAVCLLEFTSSYAQLKEEKFIRLNGTFTLGKG